MSHFDSIEKLWIGEKKKSIFNENLGIGEIILDVLKLNPNQITQVSADDGSEISCGEMRMRTLKIANYLMRKGYKQHDIVGVMALNSENLAPVLFACFVLGMTIRPMASVMMEKEITNIIEETNYNIIFCDKDFTKIVQKCLSSVSGNTQVITLRGQVENLEFVDDLIKREIIDYENFKLPKLIDVSNSTAIIINSSGTTGKPKGICKSHKQVMRNFTMFWKNESEGSSEVLLNFSTLYWISSWYMLLIGTLYGGKRVITTKGLTPQNFIDIIQKYQVTTTFSPPFAMTDFVKFQSENKILDSLRLLIIGGTHINIELCESLKRFMPKACICPIYATSECDYITSSMNENCRNLRAGSVGKTCKNIEIKIIDENGEKLGIGKIGEVCCKSDVSFSGYFKDHQKSLEVVDVDGYVFTGDLGYFDEDEFLFLVGRKKEMFKFHGVTIFASEIEDIIDEIEGVERSCIVGVLDEKTGNDIIFGFVKIISSSEGKLSENEILKIVNSKVIDDKKVRGGIHFVQEFPLTPSGKIMKNEIKKIAEKIPIFQF